MWQCRECGKEVITVVYDYKKITGKMNKNGSIATDGVLEYEESRDPFYICQNCSAFSPKLENIAEWWEG